MILVVDDDPAVTASLALLLKQARYATRTAAAPAQALEALASAPISLVLLDMNFSRQTTGEEGLALLAQIRERKPELPVVLMTAWGSISLAVAGMKAGAADFVTKPWTHQQILQTVRTSLGLSAANAQPPALTREALDQRYSFEDLAGSHPKILEVLELIGRVAATDAPVLITGESGTGKEVIANAIHRNSERSKGPLVKVNLGGIPAPLFESEMFGHVKGAFTDAQKDRRGRFELADGGTIFLDEIGDLEPSAQVKLLRVLQDRTFEVLGSSVTRTVDVRVVSATNRDLGERVEKGAFREDLLYRLNLIAVHLPALRERRGDIPVIATRFLATLAGSYGREVALSEAAADWLKAQPWPGNVRQLRHLIERTVLVSRSQVLQPLDFSATLAMEQQKKTPREELPEVGRMTIDEMEKAMIEKSLRHHAGNVSKVAESLGLSRAALYRRFEKYGIEV